MYSRFYNKDDYAMFSKWWDDWGWPPIPLEFLPPAGIVIGDDDGDICAVFLYLTDTPIVWAENYISSKDAKGKRRKEAMSMLIKEAQRLSVEMGGKVVMSAVRHDNLASKLEDNGFIVSDKGLVNYIWGAE